MDLEIGHCYKLRSRTINGCIRVFEKNDTPTFLLKCPITVLVLEYYKDLNINNFYSIICVLYNDQILWIYAYDIGSIEKL